MKKYVDYVKYSFFIWIFLPILTLQTIHQYNKFVFFGIPFAIILGAVFLGMDKLFEKLIRKNRS